ncbi:hypothetical protein [Methanobrevibacter filiformis]
MSELARLTDIDVANIQRKLNKLEEEGSVEFIKGNKNSEIPQIFIKFISCIFCSYYYITLNCPLKNIYPLTKTI